MTKLRTLSIMTLAIALMALVGCGGQQADSEDAMMDDHEMEMESHDMDMEAEGMDMDMEADDMEMEGDGDDMEMMEGEEMEE